MIPLDQAYEDSPSFRTALHESESKFIELESCLKSLTSLSSQLFTAENQVSEHQTTISEQIKQLCLTSDSTSEIHQDLSKISDTFVNIERGRSMLIAQIKEVFVSPLNSFGEKELEPIKVLRKEVLSARSEYEKNISKYMAKKESEAKKFAEEVTEARKWLHLKTLEYIDKLNSLDMKRAFELADNVISLVYTYFAFYHQGFEILKDLEPTLRDMASKVNKLKTSLKSTDMSKYLKPVDFYNPLHKEGGRMLDSSRIQTLAPSGDTSKSGYLFKRYIGTLRTTWERRYFQLKNDSLEYFSDSFKDDKTSIDLRICMIRDIDTPERKFTFEIVSPSRSYVLQAENESEMGEWVSLLKGAITRAIQTPVKALSKSDKKSEVRLSVSTIDVLTQLTQVEGNAVCAECGTKEKVEWASCNLGLVLCITCSGIHRGLGRSISKIRSLELDRWEESTLYFMCKLGNKVTNSIFEASHSSKSALKRLTSESAHAEREQWMKAKYLDRAFVKGPQDERMLVETPVQSMLVNSVKESNFQRVLKAIALGAEVNHRDLSKQTPLHVATIRGDLAMADFLLHWNADVNAQDIDGKAALHFAALKGNISMVVLLLKRNAGVKVLDTNKRMPIDIALEKSSMGENFVKVVTILRLTQLNKETKNSATWRQSDLGIEEALASLNSGDSSSQGSQVFDNSQNYTNEPSVSSGFAQSEPYLEPSPPLSSAMPIIDPMQASAMNPLEGSPINPISTNPSSVMMEGFSQQDSSKKYQDGDDFDKFIPDHFKMGGETKKETVDEYSDPWATSRWG